MRLINELREEKGVPPLEDSDTLHNAAQLQAVYQAKEDQLTHYQKKQEHSTPGKRVQAVHGKQFENVGENCIVKKITSTDFSRGDLKLLAKELFEGWKNSPGHYKNMVSGEYTLSGLCFAISNESNRLYATQVFARRGVVIEGQISENTFGIYEEDDNCQQRYLGFNNLVANMGNSVQMKGDNIYLYHHSKNYFDKIFSHPNDGIAVDVVFRDQFDCAGTNRLDMSPIYDGVLLEPVYTNELKANNEAESDYRVITKIGELPHDIIGRDFQISLIVLSEGKKCTYLVPGEVDSRDYDLIPILPYFDSLPDTNMVFDGIIYTHTVNYDFERNQLKPVEYPELTDYHLPIHSVTIHSYTSIEGDTLINNRIHDGRAKTIIRHLRSKLDFSEEDVKTEAKENWDHFYFQLQYNFADSLVTWPKDSLRKLVKSKDTTLKWDELLFEQRASYANINYAGHLNDSSTVQDTFSLNLKTAIATKNWPLANKTLYNIYKRNYYQKKYLLSDEFVFQAFLEEKAIMKNAAAVLSQIYAFDLRRTTIFIDNWLKKRNFLDLEQMSNLVQLYTLTGDLLLDRWDLPSKKLSNVVHPEKIAQIPQTGFSEELILNLQITYLHYYGQINDQKGISRSFNFIANYFEDKILKPEDHYALCLFFNSWSMYSLTVKHLYNKFEKGELNEDGVFLLWTTWSFYDEFNNPMGYSRVQQRAREMNSKRWCNYVRNNFQILRNEEIKSAYCAACNES